MPTISPRDYEAQEKKAKYFEQELKAESARLAALKKKYDELHTANVKVMEAHAVLADEKAQREAQSKKKKKSSNKMKLKEKREKTAAASKIEREEAEASASALATLQREENLEVYRNVSAAYVKVSQLMPDITLKRVLVFQDKFILADADSSGLIDEHELAKLLTSCCDCEVTLEMAVDVIKQVDTDDSGHLDFVEVMVAGDKFTKGELTQKPKQKKSKGGEKVSKACVIS